MNPLLQLPLATLGRAADVYSTLARPNAVQKGECIPSGSELRLYAGRAAGLASVSGRSPHMTRCLSTYESYPLTSTGSHWRWPT